MNATEKRMAEMVARANATKAEAQTWMKMVTETVDGAAKLRYARQLVSTLEEHERVSVEMRTLFVALRRGEDPIGKGVLSAPSDEVIAEEQGYPNVDAWRETRKR